VFLYTPGKRSGGCRKGREGRALKNGKCVKERQEREKKARVTRRATVAHRKGKKVCSMPIKQPKGNTKPQKKKRGLEREKPSACGKSIKIREKEAPEEGRKGYSVWKN